MKAKFLTLSCSLVALCLLIQSCGDDEAPVKNILITSHRGTGQFYSIDLKTGTTTPIFTITQTGTTLKDFRAFVYHPKEDKYFLSEAANSGGDLFSVNIDTKEATLINDNNSAVPWDAVVNWAVDTDDSLFSVGDFNGDGNGFVKFGTSGGQSGHIASIDDICCGFGMLYNKQTGVVTIGNSDNADDGEVILERYTKAGVLQGSSVITTFNNFPEGSEMTTNWLTTKCLAQDGNGALYGIVYNDGTDDSYLVSIDIESLTVTYITTLGADNNNQFNLLAFVPENKL